MKITLDSMYVFLDPIRNRARCNFVVAFGSIIFETLFCFEDTKKKKTNEKKLVCLFRWPKSF